MIPFGTELQLDLYNCNPETISDEEKIREFVIGLCKLINMKRNGDTIIVRFGEDARITGYSMTKLIETSLISAHFAESTNAVYLNVFSCKGFIISRVLIYAKKFFQAQSLNQSVT